jgi:hypothetical protein
MNELPPLAVQAANLAGAVARAATAAVTGAPVLADEATAAARLAVCGPCDQRTEGGRCAGCGCWIVAKTRIATETCPLGRWPEPPPAP